MVNPAPGAGPPTARRRPRTVPVSEPPELHAASGTSSTARSAPLTRLPMRRRYRPDPLFAGELDRLLGDDVLLDLGRAGADRRVALPGVVAGPGATVDRVGA